MLIKIEIAEKSDKYDTRKNFELQVEVPSEKFDELLKAVVEIVTNDNKNVPE